MKEGRCSLCNGDITQPLLLRELTDCPRCRIRATPTWQLDLENAEMERRHQELQNQRGIVGLVACGEAKRPGRHPARRLYRLPVPALPSLRRTPSARDVRHLGPPRTPRSRPAGRWYDERVAEASRPTASPGASWRPWERLRRPSAALILAGEAYARGLLADLAPGWIASDPLRGMPLFNPKVGFKRLRFLKANLERPAGAA